MSRTSSQVAHGLPCVAALEVVHVHLPVSASSVIVVGPQLGRHGDQKSVPRTSRSRHVDFVLCVGGGVYGEWRRVASETLHRESCVRTDTFEAIHYMGDGEGLLHRKRYIGRVAFEAIHSKRYIRSVTFEALHSKRYIRSVTFEALRSKRYVRSVTFEALHSNSKKRTEPNSTAP